MFGEEFWNHVIIEVTKWKHHSEAVSDRKDQDEAHKTIFFNNIFSEKPYNVKEELPVVFIDSLYKQKYNENLKLLHPELKSASVCPWAASGLPFFFRKY